MSITHWPSSERPREKLLESGAQRLSNAELIAILIQKGRPGKDAITLAREWLQHYGSLSALLTDDFQNLSQLHGLGKAIYCQFKAILELQRRYLEESLKRKGELLCAEDAKMFLSAQLRHHKNEVFGALFLDNQHRIIQFENLFYGSIRQARVYPREIVKRALSHNSAALIIAHNHPSGVVKPSQSDQRVTKQLEEALGLVEIRLIDHIIVAGEATYSFAENGLL
jgi:DNA repair protein RadC